MKKIVRNIKKKVQTSGKIKNKSLKKYKKKIKEKKYKKKIIKKTTYQKN